MFFLSVKLDHETLFKKLNFSIRRTTIISYHRKNRS